MLDLNVNFSLRSKLTKNTTNKFVVMPHTQNQKVFSVPVVYTEFEPTSKKKYVRFEITPKMMTYEQKFENLYIEYGEEMFEDISWYNNRSVINDNTIVYKFCHAHNNYAFHFDNGVPWGYYDSSVKAYTRYHPDSGNVSEHWVRIWKHVS